MVLDLHLLVLVMLLVSDSRRRAQVHTVVLLCLTVRRIVSKMVHIDALPILPNLKITEFLHLVASSVASTSAMQAS